MRTGPADYQVRGERRGRSASAQANARRQRECAHHHRNTGSNLRSAGADGAVLRPALGRRKSNWIQRTLGDRASHFTKAQADLERYKPLVEKESSAAAVDAAGRSRLDQGRRGRRRPTSRLPSTQ